MFFTYISEVNRLDLVRGAYWFRRSHVSPENEMVFFNSVQFFFFGDDYGRTFLEMVQDFPTCMIHTNKITAETPTPPQMPVEKKFYYYMENPRFTIAETTGKNATEVVAKLLLLYGEKLETVFTVTEKGKYFHYYRSGALVKAG